MDEGRRHLRRSHRSRYIISVGGWNEEPRHIQPLGECSTGRLFQDLWISSRNAGFLKRSGRFILKILGDDQSPRPRLAPGVSWGSPRSAAVKLVLGETDLGGAYPFNPASCPPPVVRMIDRPYMKPPARPHVTAQHNPLRGCCLVVQMVKELRECSEAGAIRPGGLPPSVSLPSLTCQKIKSNLS